MRDEAHPSTALRLTGRDVLPLLHRVTTQKLDDLAAGEARTTLFCDHRGRLLHRATVAHASDGAVWLLRHDAPGEPLAAAVDRVVFREDVKIDDRSRDWTVSLVQDDAPAGAAAGIGAPPLRVRESAGFALVLAPGGEPYAGLSEFERVARGHARHGIEITDAFNAYDVNLGAHVHLNKGCFTGQEVLLRLVTRDRVRRRLVRLAGAGDPPAPQNVAAGGEIAGQLTGALAGPTGWIALAVVRVEPVERGETFALADGRAIATVHAFPIASPLGRE